MSAGENVPALGEEEKEEALAAAWSINIAPRGAEFHETEHWLRLLARALLASDEILREALRERDRRTENTKAANERSRYLAETVVAAEQALQESRREVLRLREALRQIHKYNCGCDQPGRLDLCVAQPVVLFAALAPEPEGGER